MLARYGCLSILPWILFAQMSWEWNVSPVLVAAGPLFEVPPEIDDRAAVFSLGAKRDARQAVQRIRSDHRILVLIETVDSLQGAAIAAAAQRRAGPLGADGLYVLVVEEDQDAVVVLGRNRAHGLVSERDQAAIREAFLAPLRAGDADLALEQGVRSIGTTLALASKDRPRQPGAWERWVPLAIGLGFMVIVLGTRPRAYVGWSRRRRRRVSMRTAGRAIVATGSA